MAEGSRVVIASLVRDAEKAAAEQVDPSLSFSFY
jgi:hypothetical protein